MCIRSECNLVSQKMLRDTLKEARPKGASLPNLITLRDVDVSVGVVVELAMQPANGFEAGLVCARIQLLTSRTFRQNENNN